MLVVVFASPAMDATGGAKTKAEKSPGDSAVIEMECGSGAVDVVGVDVGFEVMDTARDHRSARACQGG
jgi:hypothetical protein